MYIIKISPTNKVEKSWKEGDIKYNAKSQCFFIVDQLPLVKENETLYFNPKTQAFYTKDKELSNVEEALFYAKQIKKGCLDWFSNNDWKVNKHHLGEWADEDPRWQKYLAQREETRKQYDQSVADINKLQARLKELTS